MPSYGRRSKKVLKTLNPDLIEVLQEVIKHVDISLLEGHRGEEKQNRMVGEGTSKLIFPNSEHNKFPSNAVDFAPYPIKWENSGKNYQRFAHAAGIIIGIGIQKGIFLRWGGDWDRDGELLDNKWDDLPHIELI